MSSVTFCFLAFMASFPLLIYRARHGKKDSLLTDHREGRFFTNTTLAKLTTNNHNGASLASVIWGSYVDSLFPAPSYTEDIHPFGALLAFLVSPFDY